MRECALGDGAGDSTGQRFEELIEQDLQSAFPGAQQKGDEDGKREDALAGEVFGAEAMLGDEGRIAEGLGQFGEDFGMDSAKPGSSIFLCESLSHAKHFIKH